MKIKTAIFFTFFILLSFNACGKKEKITQNDLTSSVQNTQNKNYNFKLQDLEKKQINLAIKPNKWILKQYQGKVVLLDFFATWCPPCKAEIPHFNKLREKYKGKLEIIGFDIGTQDGKLDNPSHIKKFIKKFKIKYPIINSETTFKLFTLANNLNPNGAIPFTLVFGKDGTYIDHFVGAVPIEMIESDVKKALEEK